MPAAPNLSGNERFRQRVFDITLQGATQRPRTVAAITKRLVENPLLGFLGDRDRDRLLRQVGIQL